MPLDGKTPILSGWSKRLPPTEEDIRRWVKRGHNLAVRTGRISGILVVDVEASAPDPTDGLDLPPTVTARTGSGGWHYYYRAPTPYPGNTARRFGPNTDTRCEGGQVVLPGSIHPDTGEPYTWHVHPDEAALADAPECVLHVTPSTSNAPPPGIRADAWATAMLVGELSGVASTPSGDGMAHHRMMQGAFRVGQVVGAGLLDSQSAVEQLVSAGIQAGWDEKEARRCAFDGVQAGTRHPRGPASITLAESDEIPDHVEITEPSDVPTVLTPGAHKTADGQYVEVSSQAFARAVLDSIPRDILYRRDTVAGIVNDARFLPVGEDELRRICDLPNVKLGSWRKVKVSPKGEAKASEKQALVYENCSPANARLVRSLASVAAPEIKLLTSYPVLLPSGKLSPPGFHEGVYYAGPTVEPETDPAAIRAHLADLLIDFPFEDEASRVNFLGLLLTPMVRPYVGKVPLHLVTSPQAGTGKSKLVEEVFGATYLGEPLSASMLPERPEERAKWLTALLLSGETLVHLDNLPAELDSANLASLVTASRVSDRLLGSSTFLRLENVLSIAATGNNVVMSSEVARRTVVVRLVWTGEGPPDRRTAFQHPPGYATTVRARTLSCLAGAAMAWDRTLRPGLALGSFETWAGAVGGILAAVGIPGHLSNADRWREATDTEQEALLAMCAAWQARYGDRPVRASEIADALHASLCAILESPSAVSVGKLLRRLVDRRIGPWTVGMGWDERRNKAYTLRTRDNRHADTDFIS